MAMIVQCNSRPYTAQGAIMAGCSELTIKGNTGQERELPKEEATLFFER